jgi:pimeloyl-ACP methyl ester carboxylesterase
MARMQNAEIEVCGTRVAYLEAGSGPPVLFLHGIDGPAADPLIEALSAAHRIIMPQIPGFGRSAVPEWMTGVGDAAYFCLDFLKALGLDRVHLAGHSIGGWIAAEMAVRSTARFSSLTLIAPAGVVSPVAPAHDVFLLSGELAVRAQFHDQALADKELAARADQEIDIVLQNRTGLARLAWTPRMASVQLPHWLHRIDIPTLLIWGEQDGLVPFICHETFLREIAGAELLRLPACGHAVAHERGPQAAKRIGAFLSEHRA